MKRHEFLLFLFSVVAGGIAVAKDVNIDGINSLEEACVAIGDLNPVALDLVLKEKGPLSSSEKNILHENLENEWNARLTKWQFQVNSLRFYISPLTHGESMAFMLMGSAFITGGIFSLIHSVAEKDILFALGSIPCLLCAWGAFYRISVQLPAREKIRRIAEIEKIMRTVESLWHEARAIQQMIADHPNKFSTKKIVGCPA